MDGEVKHFLFVYDRRADRLISNECYGGDAKKATTEYRAAEILYAGKPWIDIVLIGSDSLETIKQTHRTYFEGEALKSIEDALIAFP